MQTDFEDIKMQIQELHPDFFNRLSEKAIKKLTLLDLKYCTYLYLKMSTKQIAQALHVEPQSVRMFKYRLKQKFGLDKDVVLEDFWEIWSKSDGIDINTRKTVFETTFMKQRSYQSLIVLFVPYVFYSGYTLSFL